MEPRSGQEFSRMKSYQTKDSGEREEFDSGMVRDIERGKPRFDLLFPKNIPFDQQMLTRFAGLMARGADKYGERNWEKGNSQVELDRAYSSAARHFAQWIAGETDEDHAAAVFFNIMQAETLRTKIAESMVSTEVTPEEHETARQMASKTVRCFESCPDHALRVCHKESGHSFKHRHDNHWWGEDNDS
jgi:hypothetical protein